MTEPTLAGGVSITEDEAALYDRQIRLWGLEAQQRMRNATILVINLKGLATEVIKNIVLAGIGKLILIDGNVVSEEDLGSGFFFRDEDVGKKRVDAAKSRIESLNPLVAVETVSSSSLLEDDERLEAVVTKVDLICLTDRSKHEMQRIDDLSRRLGKMFYAGGTFGLVGYILCDLIKHDYLAPERASPKEPGAPPKMTKYSMVYPPLRDALKHTWKGLTRKQTKELNPAVVFSILSILEYQEQHEGKLPGEGGGNANTAADELAILFDGLLRSADVNTEPLPHLQLQTISQTAHHEFSPVCAVVGGMLAQDMLKALAAREAPLANFFTFDGNSGGGTVCRLGVTSPAGP